MEVERLEKISDYGCLSAKSRSLIQVKASRFDLAEGQEREA